MIRCIYCGMCEEVCPEQAIFLAQRLRHHRPDPRGDGARQRETARDRRRHARRRPEVERKEVTTDILDLRHAAAALLDFFADDDRLRRRGRG